MTKDMYQMIKFEMIGPRLREFRGVVLGAVLVGFCLTAWSCSKDPETVLRGRELRFEVAPAVQWTDASGNTPPPAVTSLPGDVVTRRFSEAGSPVSLYLHAECTAGIGTDEPAAKEVVTRAAPVSNLSTYGAFGVTAFAWSGAWSDALVPNYMYNVRVNKSGSSWLPEGRPFWPSTADYQRFYAYAPYDGAGIVLSGSAQAGVPSLAYTVPSDVAEQKDLLTACTDDLAGSDGGAVSLSFTHALTAVKFSCGGDMSVGTVKSISLKGVYSQGTYDLGTKLWSDHSSVSDFGQQLDLATSGTPGSSITGSGTTFMMLPQTLPQTALLELVFNDGSKDHTLTANIGGSLWPQGSTVTYNLSTSSINWSYTLEVAPPASYTYLGGSDIYNVKSYRTNSGGREAVSWDAEYSVDGGVSWSSSKPSWLTAFTASDAGSTSVSGVDYTVSVGPQRATIASDSEHTRILQAAAELGSGADPYDLSMHDIDGRVQPGMTTANCYVVRAPGTYRLPLVYGNAVKGGATNTDSFNPGAVVNGLSAFPKHDDEAIVAPCLTDNPGVVPASAEMLWNDANVGFMTVEPELATFPATVDGVSKPLGYLVFTIGRDNIQQGNALVAVRDASGDILWSWHIWVTDESLAAVGVSNHMNEVNYMMPVNLGWCSSAGKMSVSYAERSCRIRITQSGSGSSKTFTVTQSSYSDDIPAMGGNSPYYQWGRKDPFLPSVGTANEYKPYCGEKWSYSTEAATLGANIRNPVTIYNTSDRPNTSTAYNLWNARNTRIDIPYDSADEPVVKTVYDPCPPGFHVAPANAFTGFNTSGTNTGGTSYVNAAGSWHGGWDFHTGGVLQGGTLFFPTQGMRQSSSGGLSGVTTGGYCWTSGPSSESNAHSFNFNASYVYPSNASSRSYGFSVRPVRE